MATTTRGLLPSPASSRKKGPSGGATTEDDLHLLVLPARGRPGGHGTARPGVPEGVEDVAGGHVSAVVVAGRWAGPSPPLPRNPTIGARRRGREVLPTASVLTR